MTTDPANREQWEPQRSPLPKGAETHMPSLVYQSALPPQRSPLPKGAETAPQITAL